MTQITILRRLLLAFVASVVVAACGGGGSGDAAPPATIGAAGGTVASPEGASVTIPAGALTSDVAIAVTKVATGAPALPQVPDVQAAGDVFALTPHGTTFAAPVTLSVPFDPTHMPAGGT